MPVLISLRRLRTAFLTCLVHRCCGPRLVTITALLMIVSLGAGCGTPALRGPSAERARPATSPNVAGSPTAPGTGNRPGTTSSSSAGPSSAEPQGVSYAYRLPVGDTPNAQDDAVVYMYLLRGNCAFAQKYLNQNWYRLGTGGPRTVLMLQAGVEMCRGNGSAARYFVQLAATRYGWAGLAKDEWSCNIYRATGSAWQQVPQSSLTCPSGDIPLWPGNRMFPSNRPCEDPRTSTGECPGVAPSIEPATPTPSESTTPTPTASSTAIEVGSAMRTIWTTVLSNSGSARS